MKVAISYSDGLYCMYDPSTRKFAAGVNPEAWLQDNTIDIPEEEWRLYQEHMAQVQEWQRRICAYDNLIHERKGDL